MARRRIKKTVEKLADKPESPVSVALAMVQFALIVVGIIGLATLIFGGEGLVADVAGKIANAEFGTVLVYAAMFAALVYFGGRWFEKFFDKNASKAMGTLAMYLMMLLGAYYVVRYLMG